MADLLATLDVWLNNHLADQPLGWLAAGGATAVLLLMRARRWPRR